MADGRQITPSGSGNSGGSGGGGDFMANMQGRFRAAMRRGDIAMALGFVLILVIMMFPLPTWLLDMFLALSISFSILILMTALFIQKPLEFNSFPTILLVATSLRLALNIATTRLILGHGHEGPQAAGHVIEAFGAFLVSGNFVIGIIVFAILVIINFVVITKGSGRIAEVAARFTLDAMPGKQMAVDADLSSGLINEEQAKARRKELEEESAFFGAMDGASKFVRGDAVAGILITFINVIGGIIIGTAQMGLSLNEATETYTILTVGDGLVSQIPALIVSTAAGLLVTKGGMEGATEKAVFGQVSNYPAALGIGAAMMGGMSLLPGIPMIWFMGAAIGMGYLAWFLGKRQKEAAETAARQETSAAAEAAAPPAEEPIANALRMDYVRLELGYGLLSLISTERGQKLTDQIKALRRQMAADMGFVMPSVRIQDNMQLPANTYIVRVKEIEAGRGDLRPNMLLVMDPRGEEITLAGEKTIEPTFNLPAMWVEQGMKEEAMFRGYTVVDPQTVITTHLTEVVKDHMPELLSYAETQKLLDELEDDQKKLVEDIVPGQISVGGIQRVLQALLTERISIRDLPTILEGIGEATAFTRNPTFMTEHVRSRLARQLSDANSNADGVIPLVTLSPEWEQIFAESLVGNGEEKQLSMPPSQLQEFINKVRSTFERLGMMGESPVLLTSPGIRPYVRSIVERFRPATVVMSQNEIHPKAQLKTMGQI
ncbi:flagellar biosynthesis protein FlhA [Thalassospira profundimaris]|uniref:Flagellar biosynthesis protein FlhA n=1 Tax=Thalassospira profundimaris TaxID=502049 RepID=A0A367X3V5_9PROT|nr:flagellar biosynthesis protein FlhA [Thalassospira profundimaris]RCK48267.1 flagellar biosynthesis protein FlhA [Thalassospira profundimaris]